jgi:hypothetical protein
MRGLTLQSKKPPARRLRLSDCRGAPVIEFREPPRTGFELTWSLVGIRFRVLPSFFLFSALWAYAFVALNFTGILVDVACIFVAVLFTEFVQGLVYRSYGLRSTVLIQEFGGGIYPEAAPHLRIQRIVAALSNPASAWLLFAVVYYSNQEYGWKDAHPYFRFAYLILAFVTVFWGILGFLPMFPYPGGRVMLEIFSFVSPRNGLTITLWLSILIGLAIIADTAAFLLGHGSVIPFLQNLGDTIRVIMAVFFAIATIHNWQLLQIARSQRRQYSIYDDHDDRDDHAHHDRWER